MLIILIRDKKSVLFVISLLKLCCQTMDICACIIFVFFRMYFLCQIISPPTRCVWVQYCPKLNAISPVCGQAVFFFFVFE